MKDVALKYQKILLSLSRYENGDVSDSMTKHGLIYKINYGVSIPVIDKIARDYTSDSNLAFFLWNQEIRECKLLALRIFNNKVDVLQTIQLIADGIENSELAEQAAQYFFFRLENPLNNAIDLIKNNNEYCNLTGLIVAAKIAQTDKNLSNNVFIPILNELKNMKFCHSLHQKRGLARALLQIGLRNNELKSEILNWIENHCKEHIEYKDWLDQEVKYYLTN